MLEDLSKLNLGLNRAIQKGREPPQSMDQRWFAH